MELAIMTTYAPPKKAGHLPWRHAGRPDGRQVIGPLFGGLLAEIFGMRMSFFLAAGALFLNFLILVFFIGEPPDTDAPTETAKAAAPAEEGSLWHHPLIRNMLIFAVFVQMVILIIQPVLTTYVTELAGHLDNLIFISGLVFSLGGFASAVSSPLWGRFGQHHGFHTSLTYALFATSLVFFLQAVPDDLYYFAATQFAIGLFFSGIYPSINAILAENTTAHMKGRVFGLLFSAQQIGSMAGPLLGRVIATFVGIKFVFVLAGVIVLIMSIFARRQQKNRHAAISPITKKHPVSLSGSYSRRACGMLFFASLFASLSCFKERSSSLSFLNSSRSSFFAAPAQDQTSGYAPRLFHIRAEAPRQLAPNHIALAHGERRADSHIVPR